MADFATSIRKTITHEGGYQNDSVDMGNWLNGINYGTKWGITPHTLQAYFPHLLSDPNCVRNLDMDTAIACYRQGYWKQGYSQLNDQLLADKLFDCGVLFGVATTIKLFQISLNPPGEVHPVPDTGVFGEMTLAAANDHGTVAAFQTVLINHCMDVVNRNPQDAKYLAGWTRRIQS